MLRIERTHNDGIHMRMSQGEAQEEGSAAFSLLAQLIQTGFLKLLPSILIPQPNPHLAPRHTAADDRPNACLGCKADPILMLPLQAGIRDLKGIEHAPLEIGWQMRHRSRDADES